MHARYSRIVIAGLLLVTGGCISSRKTFSLGDGKVGHEIAGLAESPSYIISWNIHKASDERFVREVGDLLADVPSDERVILCLQEARSSTYEIIKGEHNERLSGHYTPSWHYPFSQRSTGVLTIGNGVNFHSTAEQIHSKHREFYFVSPKVSLRSEIDLGDGHKLQVINCHGLNFVPAAFFDSQLEGIFESLKGNKHPAIVCGDFNVWSPDRLESLRKKAERVGLYEADNHSPGKLAAPQWLRGLNVINGYDPDLHLDRFFTRGVKVLDCYSVKDSLSSDHLPVVLRYKLDTKERF